MVSKSRGVILVFLLCCVWLADSHVRFVCPRPATPRSDISIENQKTAMGSCGVDMNAAFEQQHVDLRPGLFTLRFEETKFHRNSPFRVSLHQADSEEHCVLLDHIPHNNLAVLNNDCTQNGNIFPVGVCDKSTYYITVNIPDIQCDRCHILLSHILLDHKDEIPCDFNNGTCEAYGSCTSIKIIPTVVGAGRNMSSCARYEDNVAGDWPFRPQEYYKVELGVGGDEVDPMVVLDPMHRHLLLDIPRRGFPTEVEEVQMVLNDSIVWRMAVTELHRSPDTVAVVWSDMDDPDIDHLKAGHLVLNIKCNKESYAGNLSLQMQNYTEGVYTAPEAAEYTPGGWLSDYRFRGLHAQDLAAISPAGPCVPSAKHFVTFVHPHDKKTLFSHGILAASIVGDFADITMALYNIRDLKDITILGSQLLGAHDLQLPVSRVKNNILQVSLDVSQQTPYLDTVQFLKKVMVRTTDPSLGLSGNFEEGMHAILRDGRDVKGVGAFQFTKGQWLKYEILVTGLASNVTSVELVGDGGLTYNLSSSVWHLSPSFCLIEGLIENLSSQLLLQLWQGRLLLTVHANSSTLHGMVTAPGPVYCKEARDTACFALDLLPGGQAQPEGQERVLPQGKAVFFLDEVHILQYSIQVDHVRTKLVEACIRDGEDLVFTIKLLRDPHHHSTYSGTGHLQASADLREKLSRGGLRVEVFPPSLDPTALVGYLPPVKDHLHFCVQPKHRFIGEQRGFWSPEAAPFKTLFAIVGDTLFFKYRGNVSLFSFNTKEDLMSCNFSLATRLGPEVTNSSTVTFSQRLDSTRSLYLASQGHCNDTPPLRLCVSVIQPAPPSVGDSTDQCGSLVFSDWRQQRLDGDAGPSPTGPAVAGVVVGALVAAAFFCWDRRLQRQQDLAVPSARFQRF